MVSDVEGWFMSLNSVGRFALDHASSLQCALFLLIFAGGWITEKLVFSQSTTEKLRHSAFNIAFLAVVTPVQLVTIAVCIAVAQWNTAHHWGLVYFLPHAGSLWIQLGLMFVVLDFLDYAYHRTAHRIPFLWRLHLVHHSDQAVDVSTTFREHPVETLIRVSFLTLSVFICGASLPVLILRQTVESVANISQHITFNLPPRAARRLGWLFVTPNLHHAHHHFQLPGTDCNYGDVFSIWDRIFGTFAPMPSDQIVFGVDSHMGTASRSFPGLLGLPQAARAVRRRYRATGAFPGTAPSKV
jgi:sterol desaturase/sphingolipid hydroxylase (fatty acid hydroxylase superfamily)